MKKLEFILIALLVVALLGSCKKKKEDPTPANNNPATYSYTKIADFPGSGRSGGVAFVINGYGYTCVADDSSYTKKFYKYDPIGNSWSAIADFGGMWRHNAIAFVLNGTAYVGLGYGMIGNTWTDFNDIWRYDPAANSWSQMNNFPVATSNAQSFVVNSVAYVMDGSNVYEYNSSSDTWVQKANFPGGDLEGQAVFVLGNKAYVGTGVDLNSGASSSALKNFWEYNPAIDSWTKKADFPGTGVSMGVGFALGNYGFIGTGYDSLNKFYNQMYRYDPSTNSWASVASFAGGPAVGLVNFVIGNAAYLGTGVISGVGKSSNFYKFQ